MLVWMIGIGGIGGMSGIMMHSGNVWDADLLIATYRHSLIAAYHAVRIAK